jgi:hypothetical protein
MNHNRTKRTFLLATFLMTSLGVGSALAQQPKLIATSSISATYEDFAVQTAAPLENGIPGNRLGGMGSGLAYMGGDNFLALPDRGPNAKPYSVCLDDTASYINRFQTLHMSLSPSDPGSALPFTLTPMVTGTTLLHSDSPLVYGAGCGGIGSGAPALNSKDHTYYFTGRSDNFDSSHLSTYPRDARFDTESIRVANDRKHVYISDEYGPYVYEFDLKTGVRTRAYTLPDRFAISNLNSQGALEISGNTTGRVANKGMEGLAITPDGKWLVGAMQSPLLQDGGTATGLFTRIVMINVQTGATKEYSYPLDNVKTTVSDILAVNDHEFLVDERDSKGFADTATSVAVIKKLYLIDVNTGSDVSNLTGNTDLGNHKVVKTLFLDVVQVLNANGIPSFDIPAKLEGIAFGQDVVIDNETRHTLYIANDNDYNAIVDSVNHPGGKAENPNRFFVFSFTAHDLPDYVPQQFRRSGDHDGDHDEDNDDQ